ncbi:MAG TPA: serine/threonine-protein kinase [Pseudonocardiaceae bacterium]|jgi:serine/threonine-protein kinase|nr:serine/threonine-protein kinase [Pseudonocardiaceae bacterium]
MLSSGQLLAQRYRLTRRIAVGGMGEVWEGADTRLDRKVAVKVLKPELCGNAEFLHRFRAEARTTASLNHPGIAATHDYGETASTPDGPEDTAYLVMELVEGEPLSAILARVGRLPADTTLNVLEQAGNALQAAHERGYVHRDVKPGNIMVSTAADGAVTVKLTDFGIAKAADSVPVTRSGMVMGTAHYIAPEQAVGQEAEPGSDVYSLAVVGYECLVGHRPFLNENAVTVAMMHIRDVPPPLPSDVPPGIRALIEATMTKDPRQRYASGGEFAAAAAAVRAGRPLPTPSGLIPAGPVVPVGSAGSAGQAMPLTPPLTPGPPAPASAPMLAPTPASGSAPLPPIPAPAIPAQASAGSVAEPSTGPLLLPTPPLTPLPPTPLPPTAPPPTAPPTPLPFSTHPPRRNTWLPLVLLTALVLTGLLVWLVIALVNSGSAGGGRLQHHPLGIGGGKSTYTFRAGSTHPGDQPVTLWTQA